MHEREGNEILVMTALVLLCQKAKLIRDEPRSEPPRKRVITLHILDLHLARFPPEATYLTTVECECMRLRGKCVQSLLNIHCVQCLVRSVELCCTAEHEIWVFLVETQKFK